MKVYFYKYYCNVLDLLFYIEIMMFSKVNYMLVDNCSHNGYSLVYCECSLFADKLFCVEEGKKKQANYLTVYDYRRP